MPRTSTRISSARAHLNDDRSASKENLVVEANASNINQVQTAAQASRPIQPGISSTGKTTSRGRGGRKKVSEASPSQVHDQNTGDAPSSNEPLSVLNRDSGLSCPAPREDDATPSTPHNNPEPNSPNTNTNTNHDLNELQRLREERDKLLVQIAEVQNLRIQYDTSRPSQSNGPTQPRTLIPRPEGRRINLQDDMGLANDRLRFLSIRRTMKDVLNRGGLDYMVRWEHQPKDKLARIFHVVKDRQPYLKRFAHNWPIEEYIKRHHKHARAYHRRLANDGTNTTIPNVSSEEISDSQGDVPSDPDMYLDDL